jgi:hypothetical protein
LLKSGANGRDCTAPKPSGNTATVTTTVGACSPNTPHRIPQEIRMATTPASLSATTSARMIAGEFLP